MPMEEEQTLPARRVALMAFMGVREASLTVASSPILLEERSEATCLSWPPRTEIKLTSNYHKHCYKL